MVNLQHLHCWPFRPIHVFSLPPLAYKRRPGQPLPSHTSSQAFFLSFSSPIVQRSSLSLCLPVLRVETALSHYPSGRRPRGPTTKITLWQQSCAGLDFARRSSGRMLWWRLNRAPMERRHHDNWCVEAYWKVATCGGSQLAHFEGSYVQ
jgi:hypothetical protein